MSSEEVQRRRAGDHIEPEPHISTGSVHIAEDLKKSLRILVVATILLYIVLSVFIIVTRVGSNKQGKALCALKQDNDKRIIQSQDFILKHPEGFAGISVVEIQRSISNDLITAKALSVLSC